MNAKIEWEESLKEVKTLLSFTKKNDKDEILRKTCLKSMILLLCAKLEKYVTDSADEYVKEVLKLNLPVKKIPIKLVDEFVKNELSKVDKNDLNKYINLARKSSDVQIIRSLWDESYIIDKVTGTYSSKLSNNGTCAIKDLYKRIGFEDLKIDSINYEEKTSVLGIESVNTINVINQINKAVQMRNNIIHDDATPSLTYNDIDVFNKSFNHFVKHIDSLLSNSLKKMEKLS